MGRFAWRLLALISLNLVGLNLGAETRPHYGGTLRVEIHEAPTLTDPSEWPRELVPLVYDCLVRLDEQGEPRQALAISWQHDAESRIWEFHLRPGVKFHDGSPVNAAAAAASLTAFGNVSASEEGAVVFHSEHPEPELPARLAGPGGVILRRGNDGMTTGTGPFRIAEWQPGRRAKLVANDEYWDGRPFLDAIDLQMFRTFREQSIDLELGRADVVELTVEDARREAQRDIRVWTSAPGELLALLFDRRRAAVEDARMREALALSIDRAAIQSVLLQKQGESTGALLPQWLTGYAFLFPAARDVERARQMASSLPRSSLRASLGYDPADPLARPIAERIALNAGEAGIALQVAPGRQSDLRLARLPLSSLDGGQALSDLAAALGMSDLLKDPYRAAPEGLYRAEGKLLESFQVIPLFHVPKILGLGPRVRDWDPQRWGNWRLESTWLNIPPEPRAP